MMISRTEAEQLLDRQRAHYKAVVTKLAEIEVPANLSADVRLHIERVRADLLAEIDSWKLP